MLLALNGIGYSQTVYENLNNEGLYSYLNELSNQHIINITSAIKPYSRIQISNWLQEAGSKSEKLNSSQRARLNIYLAEFSLEAGKLSSERVSVLNKAPKTALYLLPPEFVWNDSLFRGFIRPVYGLRYINSTNKDFYTSYKGLEGLAYLGKHWAGYISLQTNYQSAEPLALNSYFTQEPGRKFNRDVQPVSGISFWEIKGSFTYSWTWGSIGFVKDQIQWGDNYNGSNILSGRAPSFPMLQLKLNPAPWFEFMYFHGWLSSEVVDSTRSFFNPNGSYKEAFIKKYIAANIYTFKPVKRLSVSVGNAIIYDIVNVQPAYLVPFSFFKSIDHTLTHGIENQNSMMFFNLSSRQIKYMHLYFSVYIDEFSLSRVGDKNRHNFGSIKGGFALNGWPLQNFGLNAEITRSQPNTFEHYVTTTTFETHNFNLGHYLKGNSQDLYFAVQYNPYSTLQLKASYCYAMHGNDYPYNYDLPIEVDEIPVLKEKSWAHNNLTFSASIRPLPNVNLFASYFLDNIKGYDLDNKPAQFYLDKFTPKYLHGKTNTFMLGFNIGF